MAKAQVTTNFIFGVMIAIVGSILVMIWALGEAFGNVALSTLGKWGLGLFPIIIEIVQALFKGGVK